MEGNVAPMNKRLGFSFIWLLASFSIFLSGCPQQGGRPTIPTEPVEGIVTLDGTPLAKAEILFVAQSPGAENATALSDDGGKFVLTSLNGAPGKGALPGEYKVTVSKVETKQLDTPKKDPNLGEVWTEDTQIVPEKYCALDKTPLQATIQKGKNTVSLELQGK